MATFFRWLRPESSEPHAIFRARREAERQLEWAEVYLAAVDSIALADPYVEVEARRLCASTRELLRRVGRPHVVSGS